MKKQDLWKAWTDALVRHQKAFEELNKINDKVLSGGFILTSESWEEYQKLANKVEDTLKEERVALDVYFYARDSA